MVSNCQKAGGPRRDDAAQSKQTGQRGLTKQIDASLRFLVSKLGEEQEEINSQTP